MEYKIAIAFDGPDDLDPGEFEVLQRKIGELMKAELGRLDRQTKAALPSFFELKEGTK